MTTASPAAPPPPAPERKPALMVPGMLKPAAITMVISGGIVALVQLIMTLTDARWTQYGIRPRSLGGLWGVLDAPLLHVNWSHFLANIVPFLIFGFLILLRGLRQFIAVTVLIWLLSGFGVWLIGPGGTVIVGASGLIFGWLTFLVLRGFFSRRLSQILLGLVLLAAWGGIFWGLLPGRADISWQAHLCGALAGLLAAFLVAQADKQVRVASSPL